MKVTLYKLAANNSMQVWSCEEIYSSALKGHYLLIEWGQLGGAMQYQKERIEANASGRNIHEQSILRLKSRVKVQKDKGYCDTMEEAQMSQGMNALKLYRPMLAKVYEDVKPDLNGAFVQYKYNGYRCLVTCQNGVNIAYSRNGIVMKGLDHILNNIELPEGHTIDGELYCHGVKLQTIGSWVKRAQPDTKKLKYIVYDKIQNLPFHRRLDQLCKLKLGLATEIAPTRETNFAFTLSFKEELDKARALDFEGLMLRTGSTGYESGKRSSSLLKIKAWYDDEFVVMNVIPSADGWAVLVCTAKNGRQFKVSAPGTIEEKSSVWINKHLYIGKHVNVEYSELTAEGVPFHPTATAWRDKYAE